MDQAGERKRGTAAYPGSRMKSGVVMQNLSVYATTGNINTTTGLLLLLLDRARGVE
tara:strand:+ start:2058 stop:2225 length:168 start_codon:yes stop_codon:yes gene_type:complete